MENTEPSLLIRLTRGAGRLLAKLLILPIRFYQICISPLTPPACRFTPTCSNYAIQALRKHGPLKGSYLAARRLLSCRPGGRYGYDPVPEEFHYFTRSFRPDDAQEPKTDN